jgi:hypothetical protein
VDEIYKEFSARQGGGVLKRKQVLAAADPCGYSGDTVFVVTASGGPAEIQINVPEVIYAKESEDFVRPVLGEAELTRIRSMYRLTGGIGHILYELYRSPKATHAGRFADLSKRYYEYFRSPPNGRIRVALVSEIEALRELVPGRIPHRVSW